MSDTDNQDKAEPEPLPQESEKNMQSSKDGKETETVVEVKPDHLSTPETPAVSSEVAPDINKLATNELQIEKPSGDPVSFKVVYNKTKYDIEFPLEGTIEQLKEHLSSIIHVLPTMQKIMIKGLAKDEKTLKELGVTKGSKVMVIGSKLDDVVSVNAPKTEQATKSDASSVSTKEPLSKQKIHRKILDRGVPEDATPGIRNCKDCLPPHPISGMLNKHGGKVRLTFKLELDQVWVGTKERTEKVNMSSIHQVVSEAIEGFEQYHILGLQLGPTEASRYWIYWVPAQYIDAIKETILGKW